MVKGLKGKLALTMATTALGATLIAGGTFALFTSTTSNNGNTFTAGTVSITDYTGGTVIGQDVNFSNLAPGDTKTLTMTVKNTGTLESWVKIDEAATKASRNGDLFWGGANDVALTLDTKVVKLSPGASTTFNVTYTFPKGAGNEYQGKSGSFNVVVNAVQSRNNNKPASSISGTSTGPIDWQ